jgi:hypothetical protein
LRDLDEAIKRATLRKLDAEIAKSAAESGAIIAKWAVLGGIGYLTYQALASQMTTKRQLKNAKDAITDAVITSMPGLWMFSAIAKSVALEEKILDQIKTHITSKVPDTAPAEDVLNEANMRWDRWQNPTGNDYDSDRYWLSVNGLILFDESTEHNAAENRTHYTKTKKYHDLEAEVADWDRPFRVIDDATAIAAALAAIIAAEALSHGLAGLLPGSNA